MNAMDLKILVGTKKMCISHEPKGFWPYIFLTIFLGALKSHCPVSLGGQPRATNEEKVNWSLLILTTTSREHTVPENAHFWRK